MRLQPGFIYLPDTLKLPFNTVENDLFEMVRGEQGPDLIYNNSMDWVSLSLLLSYTHSWTKVRSMSAWTNQHCAGPKNPGRPLLIMSL